ncbi:MAG TPA: SgcJ/EcaC family oxidoreductase, partial [Nonomuraea sp.]|nr:SgcJ/EcaC family oxidoreductase [Nonomuraea sp.]
DCGPTASDEAAVRSLLTKITKAWQRGDAKEFASYYTSNGDLVDFAGNHARGRMEIVKLLQPLFDGVLENTRVAARIVDLRFLSPTVAIFHAHGRIVPTGGDSVQTFVATKGARGWLIASFQNTRVQKNPS